MGGHEVRLDGSLAVLLSQSARAVPGADRCGPGPPPAVAGGDRLGDPEPEPAAGPDVAVTAEVALKLAGRAEAAAGVADADLDRVPGDVRREGDSAARRGVPQRVVDEIVQDLPH